MFFSEKSEPSRHIHINKPDHNPETVRDHFSTPSYDNLTSQIIGLIRPKVSVCVK